MNWQKTALNALVLLAVGLGIFYLARPAPLPRYSLIGNFNQCVKAGYPAAESFPRTCRLPDGRVFTEELAPEQSCVRDDSCGPQEYCDSGSCRSFVVQAACGSDSDCLLINSNLLFSCCWAGSCQEIDYSQSQWVGVNARWFQEERRRHCSAQPACGPQPQCAPADVDDSYQARCVGGMCAKMPKSR